MKGQALVRMLLFFFFCISFAFHIVLGQETFSDDELNSLSDAELELLCLVRGFELLKDQTDEATGEPYELTHADYVDAAKQCLAIEKQMNELLEEHPELREELEEEIQKMQEEQAARIAELEGLEQQLLETGNSDKSHNAGSENTAFVSKQKEAADKIGHLNDNQAESYVTTDGTGEETGAEGSMEGGDDNLTISEEEPIAGLEDENEENMDNLGDDEPEEKATVDEDVDLVATTTPDSAISDALESENSDELSLTYLRQEFIKHVKKDIERMVKLVLPVLEPMMRAGDVAMKYIRTVIMTMQKSYDAQTQKEDEEIEDSPEAVES